MALDNGPMCVCVYVILDHTFLGSILNTEAFAYLTPPLNLRLSSAPFCLAHLHILLWQSLEGFLFRPTTFKIFLLVYLLAF